MTPSNTMSIYCSLLSGKGTFVFASNKIRFETKSEAVMLPISSVKQTIIFKGRGWILCTDATHTFKTPLQWECPWDHIILDGVLHRGNCVSGLVNDALFIGDKHHGHMARVWELACIQRLSRWSTTFDVVWLDVNTSYAFEVTYKKDEKDDILQLLDARATRVVDIGADPYTWSNACRVAKSESWQLSDWLYLFSDDSEEEDEDDTASDSDWQPPSKRPRLEASDLDSDDEAYAI